MSNPKNNNTTNNKGHTNNFHTIFRPKSELEVLSKTGSIHVAMVVGGMSAEREVSLSSGAGVGKALVENGYKVTKIDMGADLSSILQQLKPDVVFNCLHGTYGEDGCVPGLLDILRIPYTHSGVLASSVAFNKLKSREIFISNNILCAKAAIVNKSDNFKSDPIKRPYVIKPLSQGSSIGIKVVFEDDDFNFADYKFEYGDQIIVEEYIKGRELQVAVLNGKALDVLEIKLLKNRFYDYETKYTEGFADHLLPAPVESQVYKKALVISEEVNDIFGCRGLIRVEMIYSDVDHRLYMLELNTHPGMTPLSICPEIVSYNGISYKELVKLLVEDARYDGAEDG